MSNRSVPPHLLGALERYRDHRIPPGGFLTAVLVNNLTEAMASADDTSREYLFEVVSWCYTKLPGNSWGSPGRVKAWLSDDE